MQLPYEGKFEQLAKLTRLRRYEEGQRVAECISINPHHGGTETRRAAGPQNKSTAGGGGATLEVARPKSTVPTG